MKYKIINIGSFLIIVGGIYILLSIMMNTVIFEPTFPPILAMSVGGLLLVTGLLLP